MRTMKFLVPAGVLFVGMMLTTSLSTATPTIAKKEAVKCVVCHVKMGSKDLNDVGKCYKEKKALTGCEAKK
jgi:hypothetical protein